MHESQFLDVDDSWIAWIYTWKAILLASGVPYDGRTDPPRFLLSKHDDHALAVLLRTTITSKHLENEELACCVTGKRIISRVTRTITGVQKIEIVYPSQLVKDAATRFTVRGKPLEAFHYKDIEPEDIEPEGELEDDD